MIYTGFYSNMNYYVNEGLVPVAISNTIPKGYTGVCMKELSPDRDMLYLYQQRAITGLEFTAEYRKKLDSLKWSKIFRRLEALGDVVLLCYEPSGFCHRHILAKYLTEEGIEVKEYDKVRNA